MLARTICSALLAVACVQSFPARYPAWSDGRSNYAWDSEANEHRNIHNYVHGLLQLYYLRLAQEAIDNLFQSFDFDSKGFHTGRYGTAPYKETTDPVTTHLPGNGLPQAAISVTAGEHSAALVDTAGLADETAGESQHPDKASAAVATAPTTNGDDSQPVGADGEMAQPEPFEHSQRDVLYEPTTAIGKATDVYDRPGDQLHSTALAQPNSPHSPEHPITSVTRPPTSSAESTSTQAFDISGQYQRGSYPERAVSEPSNVLEYQHDLMATENINLRPTGSHHHSFVGPIGWPTLPSTPQASYQFIPAADTVPLGYDRSHDVQATVSIANLQTSSLPAATDGRKEKTYPATAEETLVSQPPHSVPTDRQGRDYKPEEVAPSVAKTGKPEPPKTEASEPVRSPNSQRPDLTANLEGLQQTSTTLQVGQSVSTSHHLVSASTLAARGASSSSAHAADATSVGAVTKPFLATHNVISSEMPPAAHRTVSNDSAHLTRSPTDGANIAFDGPH